MVFKGMNIILIIIKSNLLKKNHYSGEVSTKKKSGISLARIFSQISNDLYIQYFKTQLMY